MKTHERIFIGLGSNLGDRATTLRAALRDLVREGDIRVIRCSCFIETEPEGGPPDQSRYLNAVAELETTLQPEALLERLLEIEAVHGRRRTVAAGPRTLDLDLLLYGERTIDTSELVVPHPRMWRREFVMRPLAELCEATYLESIRRRVSGSALTE